MIIYATVAAFIEIKEIAAFSWLPCTYMISQLHLTSYCLVLNDPPLLIQLRLHFLVLYSTNLILLCYTVPFAWYLFMELIGLYVQTRAVKEAIIAKLSLR